MPPSLTLSVEELAVVIAALGQRESAAAFLKGTVGDLHPANLTGRLTAASHSLIARGLLTIDLAAGTSAFDPQVEAMLRLLLDAHHTLRCTRSGATPGDEEALTLFVKGDDLLAHELRQGVVVQLETLPRTDIAARIERFLDVPEGEAAVSDAPLGMISADTLQIVRREAAERPMESAARLAANLAEPVARQIVEDFALPETRWGSVLRLVSEGEAAQGRDESAGLLYAALPDRLWLFSIPPENRAIVHVYRGSRALLHALVEPLLP